MRRDELGRLLCARKGSGFPEGMSEVVRAGQIFLFFFRVNACASPVTNLFGAARCRRRGNTASRFA